MNDMTGSLQQKCAEEIQQNIDLYLSDTYKCNEAHTYLCVSVSVSVFFYVRFYFRVDHNKIILSI